MSLYNTYRPHIFKELVGQNTTVAILKWQAKLGKFSHSYLLYGPSGTGKTSTARILAACLTCYSMNGTGEPCNQCPSCQAVREGRHWDCFEIDCSHFRGIDDITELKRKAYLWPLGKTKVYILDEVHTLSSLAWNGLLKLLEEPPAYLTIILCTTQVSQIPDTVKSRTQVFPLELLKPVDIKVRLKQISKSEHMRLSNEHLNFIAETACGNLRSALNLLEQCYCLKCKTTCASI